MRKFAFSLLLGSAFLAACSWIPSGLHVFGTPLEKEEKRAKQETQARSEVFGGAQAAVHEAGIALEAAPPSRAVDVATEFVAEAQALLDQAQGAPKAGDIAQWQNLVSRLLSENADVRHAAEKERTENREAIAGIADKLAKATAARVQAEAQVRDYAKRNEQLADWVRTFAWIVGIALVAYLLTHFVLPSIAQEFPQVRALSTVYRTMKSLTTGH